MSDLVNLSNINSQLTSIDILPSVQMAELPKELQSLLKTGQVAMLEVLTDNHNQLLANLQIDGKSFAVELKNNILSQLTDIMTEGQNITIAVKVGAGGKLIPLPHNDISEQSEKLQPAAIVNSHKTALPQIEMTPLNLRNFVSQILKASPVNDTLKQQVIETVGQFNINLHNIGSLPSDDNSIIQPLQNILLQIAKTPNNFENLKPQLDTILNSLVGKQLGGEVISRTNNVTVVKTSVGETYFSSEIKLPISEKMTFDITSKISGFEQQLRILDKLMRTIFPNSENNIKTESILHSKGFENIKNLAANVKSEIFSLIANRLPLQGSNLFENIYNFYQAAANKDAVILLGNKLIREIMADTTDGTKVINEVNNFLASSTKETPVWRITEIPLFDGTQFSQLKIAVKKDTEQQSNSQKQKTGTRFIVETEFSRLGSFQFDGFSSVKHRSLDLIIRTSAFIPNDFCSNIINLFKNSLYNVNYSGTIKINRRQSFINLQDTNTISEGIYI